MSTAIGIDKPRVSTTHASTKSLTVRCPKCFRVVGQHCSNPQGAKLSNGRVHRERAALANS